MCHPNCPSQDTINCSKLQCSNNSQTSTPQMYQHISAPTVATHVDPSHDQQNISTEPSRNGPFQAYHNSEHAMSKTKNEALTLRKKETQETNANLAINAPNGPFQSHKSYIPPNALSSTNQSKSSKRPAFYQNCPSQDNVNGDPMSTSQDRISCTGQLPNNNNTKSYIRMVHWNAQGANQKTSAIKTAILQDELDIVMIQDTRYKPRKDVRHT